MRRLLFIVLLCWPVVAVADSVSSRFEAISSQAEAARSQDHAAEAIRLYREGTRMRPSWSDGWWYLGTLLYDQDRFSEADSAFQHLIGSPSRSGAAHAFRGLCEYETGKYDDALAEFRAWARAGWRGAPEFHDVAAYHFALLLTREGKFIEALYLMAAMAPRLGDNPELAEGMGLASLHLRYLPETYPPEDRERIWLAGKAALYAAQAPKDFDRAQEYAGRLEERYGNVPEVHAFRGQLFRFQGKATEAEREYRAELAIDPENLQSLIGMAGVDLEKGDSAEAAEFARRAIAGDAGSAEAHHLLGRVYLAEGDLHRSATELEIAKKLAPESAAVRAHLAMVYGKLGRAQEAKAESAAFLKLKSKEDATMPLHTTTDAGGGQKQ